MYTDGREGLTDVSSSRTNGGVIARGWACGGECISVVWMIAAANEQGSYSNAAGSLLITPAMALM